MTTTKITRQALDGMQTVERVLRSRRADRHLHRALQTSSRQQPDDGVSATERNRHRHDAPKATYCPNPSPGDLRDHHILRIANQRGGRADVAGDRQRYSWNGTGFSFRRSKVVATTGVEDKAEPMSLLSDR